jgi:hypothetical protein
MLGLAGNRKSPISGKSDATEFQKTFVKAYIPVQKLIIGLLIHAELKHLGVDISEKEEVHGILIGLVDTDSPTKLTEKGLNILNEYASGGYDILTEYFPTKPYSLEDFLRSYSKLIQQIQNDQINM